MIKYSSAIIVANRVGIDAEDNVYYPEQYDNAIFTKQARKVEKLSNNMIYSVVIGIQGDVFNENYDYWSWKDELLSKKASGEFVWETWIGKPNCMDHKCASVADHYGKVIDAYPHYPKQHILMVIGTDRTKDANLALGIENGYIDKVSMSCDVESSDCSYCGKNASHPDAFCTHLKTQRGRFLPVKKGMNHYKPAIDNGFIRVGEICHNSTGRELSWVSNPAFPGCKSIVQLKLAEKLEFLSDIYKARDAEHDKKIASTFKKVASKDVITVDDKRVIKQLLDISGKAIYKDWIK